MPSLNQPYHYQLTSTFKVRDDGAAVALTKEIDRLIASQMIGSEGPNTILRKTSTVNIPWVTWSVGDRVG